MTNQKYEKMWQPQETVRKFNILQILQRLPLFQQQQSMFN